MRFLLCLSLILLLGACGCHKPCIPEQITVEKTVSVREVIHDTIFVTQPDSAKAEYRLVIDESGSVKPVLLHNDPGRIIKAPSVRVRDNILTVDCYSQAEQMFAQWREYYTDSVSKTTITQPPKYMEHNLTTFEKIQMWLGRLFIIATLVFVFLLIRKYWPKN